MLRSTLILFACAEFPLPMVVVGVVYPIVYVDNLYTLIRIGFVGDGMCCCHVS